MKTTAIVGISFLLVFAALGCAARKATPPLPAATFRSSAEKLHADANYRLYYPISRGEAVQYRTFEYADGFDLDLYLPPDDDARKPLPVVIIANGLDDVQSKNDDGYVFRDLDMVVGWARAIASRGMAVITFDSRESRPKRGEKAKAPASTLGVLAFVNAHADELRLDATRIGFFSFGVTATPLQRVLAEAPAGLRKSFRCAAFECPALDKDIMPARSLPVLITRPSHISEGIMYAIDDWTAALRKAGNPLTVHDVAGTEPTPEFKDDSTAGHEVVDAILAFLAGHLLVPA